MPEAEVDRAMDKVEDSVDPEEVQMAHQVARVVQPPQLDLVAVVVRAVVRAVVAHRAV